MILIKNLKLKGRGQKFCEVNFGINFPMTDITSVKGKDAHPFYQWVKNTKDQNGIFIKF